MQEQKKKSIIEADGKIQKNHLLFLHDFTVHFDNNMSERDLRKAKTAKKMAGGLEEKVGTSIIVPY